MATLNSVPDTFALSGDYESRVAQLLRNPKLMLGSIDESRLMPESYVDHILDDAEAAVAQKSA